MCLPYSRLAPVLKTFFHNVPYHVLVASLTLVALFCLSVCFVALRPKSTAMVMAGR